MVCLVLCDAGGVGQSGRGRDRGLDVACLVLCEAGAVGQGRVRGRGRGRGSCFFLFLKF